MNNLALQHANEIFRAATPVLRINDIGGRLWRRNVQKGSRIGPWFSAQYEVLDHKTWAARTP